MNPLTSKRGNAWRNLMTAAINKALEDNLLDLNPDHDWLKWPEFTPGDGPYPHRPEHRFEMLIVGELFTVRFCDAGWHEVMFRVENDDTSASGWLERKDAPELQVPSSISRNAFSTTRALLNTYADMKVERKGYGLGRLRM